MKRLFTFLTVALLAFTGGLTANAQQEEDITSKFTSCWGGADESVVANQDGTLTYNSKAWGGLSAWIGGADWSKYASITFEFGEPTPASGQIQLQRADDLPALTQWYNAGATSVTLKFGENDMTKVNQVALQASAVGTFQIKRVYLTEAVVYEETPAASLTVNGEKNQFFPASLFAGFSENAKVVFTVEIAGSENYQGWGLGEFTTPTLTKDENWAVKDGIMVQEVKGNDGEVKYELTIKELLPALTSWPDANGNYGLVSNMYGHDDPERGTCTVTLKSVEIFEAVGAKATDIDVNVAEGDISEAIAKASLGKKVGSIFVNLQEGVTYTISSSIVGSSDIFVTGKGATIDASSLNAPFIALANVDSPTEWTNVSVGISNVTIKGLKKALFYSTCKNYLVEELMAVKSVVEVAADVTVFDFTKGSAAHYFIVDESTFYAPTATTKAFYSSQGGQKITECANDLKQNFIFTNSTFYNLAAAKNFFSHRQSNQAWMVYDVKNNIFVNCGKSGQTIKGMNGGSSGANPTWIISGNAFNFDNAETNKREDTSAAESTGDEAEPVKDSVAGIVTFTDADGGDFNGVFVLDGNKPEKLGDPRWTITYKVQPVDIEISPESGDISEAIATAAAGKPINNLSITLKEGVTYTISSSISAAGNIKIYSDGGATIDASSLTAPFIAMPNEEPTEWTIISNVTIADVTIKGLKNALFFSACKNYAIEDFMVIGSVVEVAGDATTFDFTKGSVVQNFNITNSTFYAPTATTKAFYSSQSGQKASEYKNSEQYFILSNSTFYNLAPTKNFFSHRQSNQAWMEYDVQNNIFVNCGKSGQVIKGMNGGQSGPNPTWIISGNVFNFDNAETNEREDTSAAESTGDEAEPVKDSVACIVTFTDAAAGNFNGTLELPQGAEAPKTLGDPRWKFNITTGIQTVTTTMENGAYYDLQGRRVAQPVKGLYIVNGKKVVLK